MGADFIDYYHSVDPFVVPSSQQAFFSEKLVHLPGSYQVNDSRREGGEGPHVATRPMDCRPKGLSLLFQQQLQDLAGIL